MKLPEPARRRWLFRYWVRDPVAGVRLAALHHLMRAMPTETVSEIGGRLGRFAGPRFHPVADARARQALRDLRPDLVPDAAAMDRVVGEMWHSMGRSYAEFSTEERFLDEDRVTLFGAEHLAAAKAGGGRLIVAGLHLANWEVITFVLGQMGHKVTSIYQPPRNRFETRMAVKTRLRGAHRAVQGQPGAKITYFPPSRNAGVELVRVLRAGETLVIFADDLKGGRVHAPSFGRPGENEGNVARAVRLARMVDATIVPAYAERLDGVRFNIHFLPPIAQQCTADREADIRANARVLDAAITGPILAHPEQWFMLPDFRMDR